MNRSSIAAAIFVLPILLACRESEIDEPLEAEIDERFEAEIAECLVAWETGDYRRATTICEQTFETSGIPRAGSLAAASYYELFKLAWYDSRLRDALGLAQRSFELATEAGHQETRVTAVQGLFSVLYDTGNLDAAQAALEEAESLIPPDRRLDRARLLVYRGNFRLDEGRPALARRDFEAAIELAGGDDPQLLRSAHCNLVKANVLLSDVDRAARHLEAAQAHAADGPGISLLFYRALVEDAQERYAAAAATLRAALEQTPPAGWAWLLEHRLGRAEEARGDLDAAEAAYARATAILQTLRADLEYDELKAWLLDQKRQPYEDLFRLQARAGRARDALATAEEARARTFLDAFVHAASTAPAPALDAAAAASRIDTLEALLAAMQTSAVVALRPVDELLDALGARHLRLYFDAGDELWLIVAGGGRLDLRRLDGPIDELAERFHARPDDSEAAAALGRALLPPGTLPGAGETLYVVPDGDLGRIPFAALRPDGRYLVENHPIAYVPSLNGLVAIAGRGIERGSGSPAGEPAVLGDPRGDLPAAALEARAIAAQLGTRAAVGADATLDRLAAAAEAPLLHLATHTGLGPGGPWLALADRELGADAILRGRLRPRLVVLASCASAARTGKGLWGSLGAAFLTAGSESVLASLWSIEDDPTRELITRFYRHEGITDPAGALARAQRQAIAAGQPPSIWAPFVLFGSATPLDEG